MEGFDTAVSSVMRNVIGALQTPVVLLLLLAMLFAVVLLGTLIGELVSERRKFKVSLPAFIDDLRATYEKGDDTTRQVIVRSGLLMRQKVCLVELTRHPDITAAMRESLAVGLEYREQRRYENIVKVTDTMSRVAPMLGLLGTLIPLGPGITAISSGDTDLLSSALLTAFDTTSTGLIIAAMCLIVSAIRKRWYRDYMTCFQASLECLLEIENARGEAELKPLPEKNKTATADPAPVDSRALYMGGEFK